MEMTAILYGVLACVIVALGATVHGAVGFGMGLVAAPLLLLINPLYVPGPLLVCSLVLTIMMTLREKQSIDFYGLGWGYTGRILGTIIAVTILSYLPRTYVSVLSATLVLVAVILSIMKMHTKLSIGSLITAGIASGIMSTLSSVGGPPLALLYQYEKGAKLRATLSGFFILGTVTSIGGLVIVGQFTYAHLRAAATLIPGVVLGFFLSSYAIRVLNFKSTRAAVLLISTISSLAVIARLILL